MRKLTWSQPTRRPDGHVGATARVAVRGEGGADGYYSIQSHGLNSDEVAQKVTEIGTFHVARSGRMDGFRSIQAQPIVIGEATFRVIDLTVRYPADASYCALYIDVRQIVNGAPLKVAGFPKRVLYKTPGEIPDDAAVVALITASLPVETEDLETLHAEFTSKVTEKIDAKMSRIGGVQ